MFVPFFLACSPHLSKKKFFATFFSRLDLTSGHNLRIAPPNTTALTCLRAAARFRKMATVTTSVRSCIAADGTVTVSRLFSQPKRHTHTRNTTLTSSPCFRSQRSAQACGPTFALLLCGRYATTLLCGHCCSHYSALLTRTSASMLHTGPVTVFV
jgi:hypothetical protein